MKKIIVFLCLLGALYSCQKEEPLSLEEQLIANKSGWELASYTHDFGYYTQEYDHYTNVGRFVFLEDNKGEYTYNDKTARFIYYLDGNTRILIKFYYSEITDFSSPFLFYADYDRPDYYNGYGTGWDDAFEMDVTILTDYSLRFYNYNLGIEMFLLKSE